MSSTVSAEELKVAFLGPASLANRFYITKNGSLVRISFTEEPPAGVGQLFRTAVVLSLQDAKDLAALLKQVADSEEQPVNAPNTP